MAAATPRSAPLITRFPPSPQPRSAPDRLYELKLTRWINTVQLLSGYIPSPLPLAAHTFPSPLRTQGSRNHRSRLSASGVSPPAASIGSAGGFPMFAATTASNGMMQGDAGPSRAGF